MVKDNIERIKARITWACAKSGCAPGSVTIVAVTKGRTIDEIKEALACGITDIGENRVQEALVKYRGIQLSAVSCQLRWHMVGHLQTNKVKEAVRIFDLIHSVDSARLAGEIDKQAARINKVQDVLIGVKTSPEATKSGITPGDAPQLIGELAGLKNLNVKGLMTIAPLSADPQQSRPYFRQLRELRDEVYQLPFTNYHLPVLSMGMTDDFEIAIEEGSNMVRLGRAIFEG